MEHLIATWIVAIWQNRRLGEYAPCWDPAGDYSPNTLFAAAMGQGGFAMQIPRPELFYQLLPAQFAKVHGQRGVKVRGLWYDGPALDPYRDQPSSRGGQHRGQWVIHRDPRDARTVFFQDPAAHDWHPLRWTGLPPEGEVPSFSDARVRDLLRAARQAGQAPVRCRAAARAAAIARGERSRRQLAGPHEQGPAHRARPREHPGKRGVRGPSRLA